MRSRLRVLKWVGLVVLVAILATVSWHVWQSRWPPPWPRAVDPPGRSIPPPPASARHGTSRAAPEALPSAQITHMAFSPDGRFLALSGAAEGGLEIGGPLILRQVGSPQEKVLSEEGRFSDARFLSDGQTLVAIGTKDFVSGDLDTVRFWRWRTRSLLRTDRVAPYKHSVVLAVSANGTLALVSDGRTGLSIWNIPAQKADKRLTLDFWPQVAAFSPGGHHAALGSSNGCTGFGSFALLAESDWHMAKRLKLEGCSGPLSPAFSPDGKCVALVGCELTLRESATGRMLWHSTDEFSAVAFSPDGQWLAAVDSARDSAICVFGAASGKMVDRLQTNLGPPLAWSPDGKLLAGSGSDGSVKLLAVQELLDERK